MKNPHIAYLLYVCRNARALDKERPFYGAMLRETQIRLVRIRKVNKLRAHIAKTNYSSLEARVLGLIGASRFPTLKLFPGEYGWPEGSDIGANFAEAAKYWLVIDEVQPAPRKEPVQPINWDLGPLGKLRDYQVPAIEDALSSITPHKFLAAMAECGKSPTGRVPQMVGRVQRINYRKSQEDFAKSEISRLTGFLFEPGELQSMNADELLRIFNAGVNLGRML